jgi:hypothetical protein
MGAQYLLLLVIPTVMLVGILLAFSGAIQIAEGKMLVPAAMVATPLFVAVLYFLQWQPIILCFFTLHLAGFIPLAKNLTPSDIAIMFTFGWFVINSVILKRQNLRIYHWPLFLCLLVIASIIFINFVRGGGGFRVFGSEIWGGRKYINTFIGLSFYLVLGMWRPNLKLLNKIPYLVFAAYCVDFSIWLVQYFAPSAIPMMYPFYTGLQHELYSLAERSFDSSEGVQRLFGPRTIGLGLILFCLSTSNFKDLLSPKSLLYLCVLIPLGLGLVALAGFRSYLAIGLFMVGLGAILRLKWRAFVPGIIGLTVLALVVAGQGRAYELPLQVQRALSWLPGEWDWRAVRDATGSTEWRMEIWKIWYNKYFPENPLIGRGWNIKSKEVFGTDVELAFAFRSIEESYHVYAGIGSLHNGPLTAIDVTGIIGFIFVLISSIIALMYMWNRARQIGFLNLQPVQRYVLINLTSWIVLFYFLDGHFERFIDYFFIMCGLAVIAFNQGILDEHMAASVKPDVSTPTSLQITHAAMPAEKP